MTKINVSVYFGGRSWSKLGQAAPWHVPEDIFQILGKTHDTADTGPPRAVLIYAFKCVSIKAGGFVFFTDEWMSSEFVESFSENF